MSREITYKEFNDVHDSRVAERVHTKEDRIRGYLQGAIEELNEEDDHYMKMLAIAYDNSVNGKSTREVIGILKEAHLTSDREARLIHSHALRIFGDLNKGLASAQRNLMYERHMEIYSKAMKSFTDVNEADYLTIANRSLEAARKCILVDGELPVDPEENALPAIQFTVNGPAVITNNILNAAAEDRTA